MRKNRTIGYALIFASLLFLFSGCIKPGPAPHSNSSPTPTVGMQLPAIELTPPTDDAIRTYLGLAETNPETFSPAQIECEILLIEIFSMYCPFCQREAPDVNELYQLLQDDPKLSRQIKLIGIGVGNSAFEVGIFKNKYKVEFPLFADENFTVHQQLGQVRTPFFIAIANRGDQKNQIQLTKLGGFSSPEKFIRSLAKLIETPEKGEK